MTTNAPVSHLQDALELDGEAKIDLFEVRLRGVPTIFRFWNGVTRSWQDRVYEGLACQMAGEGSSTEDQNARPTLTVVNPEMIFGPFAAEGYFDLAEVVRKRVLQPHFIGNVNQFEQRIWICARPAGVTAQGMQLDLRSTTDMPAWKTPRRTFSPPEFPFVSI